MLKCVKKAHQFGVVSGPAFKLLLKILHSRDAFLCNIIHTLGAVFLTASADGALAIALHENYQFYQFYVLYAAEVTFDFFCRHLVQAF